MQIGSLIRTETGQMFRVISFLDSGGEAFLYEVQNIDTREIRVLKIFKGNFDRDEKEARIRFLMNYNLQQKSSHIIVPLDIYKENGEIGYLMQFIPGVKLLEILENPTFSLREGIQISLDICRLAEILHQHNIAHGDLNHKNIMVNQNENGIEVYCIDLDNYFTPGAPPSRMAGQLFFLPPEFHKPIKENKRIVPKISSDLFSISVLFSEIILLQSPTVGSDGSKEEIIQALSKPWRLDPVYINRHSIPYGNYPVDVLSSDLCGLFRRGINPNVDNRPTIFEWIASLEKALSHIYVCPECGYPTIIDQSKTFCPLKKHPFEKLGFFIKNNSKTIPFDQKTMVVGRDQVNCSKKISKSHLYCEQVGPYVWGNSIGINGTYRWSGKSWIKLQYNKPFLLKKNDKLKLADIEVEVVRIN